MVKARKSGRQPRLVSSLARRQGNRQPRKTVLIVSGGTETEPKYFGSLRQELRLATVDVQIKGTGYDALSVVDQAISRRKVESFDEVWCVLDVEKPHENPQFFPAVSKARSNKVDLAVSNPAFEYWYLLHFQETNRPFTDAAELIKALKDFVPDYHKSANIFAEIYKYTDVAVARAERLLAHHPDGDQEFPNPSTLVFKLVRCLQGMAEYR